jgi:hypothetical protein
VFTNNSAIVTSVGAVSWTNDIIVGDWIKVGSEDDTKYYQIDTIDSASQVTLTEPYQEADTGLSGTDAKYAYGSYEVVAVPSTDRHIKVADRKDVPFDEDVYWLFYRNDNGGSGAKVYIRGGGGGELEQGERREVSDNQTINVLEYVGSQYEGDQTPNYTDAIVTGQAEITDITFPAASALTTGQAFTFNSANDIEQYYAWVNKDGAGGNPNIPGLTPIELVVSTGELANDIATTFETAIAGLGLFTTSVNSGIVTVENTQVGVTTDAANIDMGTGFSVSVTQDGIGQFNRVVVDDENLTKSIKRLDAQIAGILIDTPNYAEKITIVDAGAGDNELNAPIAFGTNITIPKNSINSNVQQQYTVGGKTLEVFLNGIQLHIGIDYNEVGSTGAASTQIEILRDDLADDDILYFTINVSGTGSGAGGGGSYSGVNLGLAQDADIFKTEAAGQFQFRRLAAGTNVSITQDAEKVTISAVAGVAPATVQKILGAGYTALSTDDVILVENQGSDQTITLPDATTVSGKIFDIKKLDAGDTLFVKSVSAQTLDGTDIDSSPHTITIQYESITIISDGANWWLI